MKLDNYFILKSQIEPSGLMTNDCIPKLFNKHDKQYLMYKSALGPNMCPPSNCKTVLNETMGIKKSLCYNPVENCNGNPGVGREYDARLFNMPRNQWQILDTAPYEGEVKNKYSEKLKEIHTGFSKDYSDIKSGSIQYYIDPEMEGAYSKRTGNYVTTANEDYYLYKTPMDSVWIHTEREGITQCRPEYLCGNNFLKDSINHREEIMSKQSYLFNRNRYQTRY